MTEPAVEANKALLRRTIEDVLDKGNLAVAYEVFAPDVVFHTHASPEPFRGPEGVVEFITMIRTGFPDVHFEINDLFGEGDRVAVRYTLHGTHKGYLAGLPPTDRQVVLPLLEIFHVADGRLKEGWLKMDTMNALQQLGVFPQRAVIPKPLIWITELRRRVRMFRSRRST
jgi:steroid delta-isomerase-like uncharacterized protein